MLFLSVALPATAITCLPEHGEDGICATNDDTGCAASYFNSAGVRIHYRVCGTGPDVILIHGLATNAEDNWHSLIPVLSTDYRVITLDLRGHGKSAGPTKAGAYGKAMAEDVLRLMNHLAIEQAHLVGYSMGGTLALHLAIDSPLRARSLIIAGQGWATMEDLEATASAAQAVRESGTALVLVPNPDTVRSEVRERFMKTLAGIDAAAMAALLTDYPQLSIDADSLRKTTQPILLVSGSDDRYLHRVEKLKAIRCDAKVVIITGETHLTTPSSAEFAATIAAFLQDQ